jgi:hypothetical protein
MRSGAEFGLCAESNTGDPARAAKKRVSAVAEEAMEGIRMELGNPDRDEEAGSSSSSIDESSERRG